MDFFKMHHLGNDFVVIDGVRQNININSEYIKKIANRKTGIGFDQLLLIQASDDLNKYDYKYRIFNCDGSEAEQCINGIICAAFFAKIKLLCDDTISFGSIGGIVKCDVHDRYVIVKVCNIRDFKKILISNISNELCNINFTQEYCYYVSIGNPHCIFFVSDINAVDINFFGKLICNSEIFYNGVNVGFVQILDNENIYLKTYERGVGPTLSCGSNYCATVFVGNTEKLFNNCVNVNQDGGSVFVEYNINKSFIYVKGYPIVVFRGNISND